MFQDKVEKIKNLPPKIADKKNDISQRHKGSFI